MKLFKKLLWIAFLGVTICLTFVFVYYFAVTKDTRLIPEKLSLNEKNIMVYDRENQPVSLDASFSRHETVRLNELSEDTVSAFVVTEDKRFYQHNGFDVKRIAKSALNNLKSRSFKEGASTLSQQLIKNTHLSQEKTVKRKLQEWKLTRRLEQQYTKDEILEKYLNTIYFGHNCFGLHAAAKFYFDKTPSELSLPDAAILAGLVRSPNNYSPFKNPQKCQARKETVLRCMLQNGKITEEEKRQADAQTLPLAPKEHRQNAGYLHFVFDELTDITEKFDLSISGKIQIFTGMDARLQAELENIFSQITECDKTCMVLDTEHANFKACISTVGNLRRLPGSLIKPLIVYAPAIEENILSPATPILDEKVDYAGYSPTNYDNEYHGYVSARQCLAKSLNVPAVKILHSLGTQKGVVYLEKLGLHLEESDLSLALALGGMKNGFSLRDLVTAYAAFPNAGEWCDSAFIKEIKINGTTVYMAKPQKRRVFSPDTAFLTTDMLKTTVKEGTAKKLRALPFDVAAKTGTVGTKQGNTDAYALSYTAKDCVGIWLGNADNTKIEYTGGTLPCQFLSQVNEYLYERYQTVGEDISTFSPTANIKKISLDKTTYYDTHNMMLADEISPMEYRFEEWFKNESIPTKKSDFFSNPRISTPKISLQNGRVEIHLPKDAPTCYRYRIERTDYASHTTLYEGDFLPLFTDGQVSPNRQYVYTITPMYLDKVGTSIVLPSVNTAQDEYGEIIKKEWWQY